MISSYTLRQRGCDALSLSPHHSVRSTISVHSAIHSIHIDQLTEVALPVGSLLQSMIFI